VFARINALAVLAAFSVSLSPGGCATCSMTIAGANSIFAANRR